LTLEIGNFDLYSMLLKKQLATITILVKDRQSNAKQVNEILTEYGHIIISRLGVNLNRACVDNCTALIVVVVDAPVKDIKDMTKKINKLYGICAKEIIVV
jgi:putative iron-only hydrogenase system regulator